MRKRCARDGHRWKQTYYTDVMWGRLENWKRCTRLFCDARS